MRQVIENVSKNILVAGGAGFLGSHLTARILDRGDCVTCLDNLQSGNFLNIQPFQNNPNFTFITGDVINGVENAGDFDEIYNLACPASPPQYQVDPVHTLLTNVVGSHNLLKLADRCNARVFLASTSEVYGDPQIHPQPEVYRGNVNTIGPRACYDEGKRCAETLYFDFARTRNLDIRVARIFNTYGPNMHPDDGRVVSNFIVQALMGKDITIYGQGNQTRSFCYVDDLINGFLDIMSMKSECPGPLNLGNPVEQTVLELARLIIELTGSNSELVFKPLPMDDPVRRCPDISLANETLGWAPKTQIEEGLSKTIDYFDSLLSSNQSLCAGQRHG